MKRKTVIWFMLLAGMMLSNNLSFNLAHGQGAPGNEAASFAVSLLGTQPVSTQDTRLGFLSGASVLIGRKVGDCHERTIGKLEDLVLDLASGELASTLLCSDSSGKLTPVPGLSYSRQTRGKMMIEAERKVFEKAPQIAKAGGLKALEGAMLGRVRSHFGVKEPGVAPGPLSSAARLLGSQVRSKGNEGVGLLKEIMVDMPLGRVVYLVVEPAAGVGPRGVFYVIPPVAVEADTSAGALMLKGDREQFLAGPTFLENFWTDLSSIELARAVEKYYGPNPAPATTDPKGSSSERTEAATPRRPARPDREITQAILGEIARGADGFMRLNIVITTVQGKVTLTGRVKNEKQRKIVLGAAERIVGAENVEDRLALPGKMRTAQL